MENLLQLPPLPERSLEAFLPGSTAWTDVASLHLPRSFAASAIGGDGRIYVAGGQVGCCPASRIFSAMEAYGPAISLSPASGAAGATVALTGGNFAPNATVRVFLGTVQHGTPLAAGATDDSGNLTVSVPIPAGTPSGAYPVTVVDNQSQYPVNAIFTVQ